ncbi:MAG: DUF1501 domain-containing protein [Planctomycetes bacterium]|nr:DUF1501 domain-containing protein [Planctomycetota bacterium]
MDAPRPIERIFDRRSVLRASAASLALLGLGSRSPALARAADRVLEQLAASGDDPLAPRPPHHRPRARRMIVLFMHGGPSQVDTFDYKPLLQRDDGKPLPFGKPRVTFAETGNLLGSPWRFAQHGECGAHVSELFPHVATQVDRLCFVKSMHGSNDAHGGALLKIHTGSDTFVRPSLGSWVVFGLGTENRSLPGHVTICPTLGHGGVQNWSAAFLPGATQGVPIGNASIPSKRAEFQHLRHPTLARADQAEWLDLLRGMNEEHLAAREEDRELRARLESFALAYRMQDQAPETMDLGGESAATLQRYGIDEPHTENFGRQCLMARRFIERGVRFVQCTHSYKWDQHDNLKNGHETNAREVDRPIAGLLGDLAARGLLEDTLVLWIGEFGRTPVAQGKDGRDHNPHGWTVWLAGGGCKPGHSHGATDDYGYYATVDKVHVHDLHATILWALGLDHERLTFRYAGRDFRLTDVAGNVVHGILS